MASKSRNASASGCPWRAAFTLAAAFIPACAAEPPQLAVWSEFLAYDQVAAEIATLAEFDCDLYVRVRPVDLGEPLWALLHEAAAAGVPVRAWLQIPDAGIWLNESNITAFHAFAHDLLDQAAVAGVDIDWVIFDIEPGFEFAESLAANADDPLALLNLLAEQSDPAAFTAATAELRALVESLQQRDVRVMAVILPWIVDDLLDGDADLQDLFNTPVADVPWDAVSVIVYRPAIGDLLGAPLAPTYVGSYARDMRRFFDDRAEMAIGNIGIPGLLVAPGYTNPLSLALDAGAAREAGVVRVSAFSLDGMLELGGTRLWLEAMQRPISLRPGAFAPVTRSIRRLIRAGDAIADRLD